MKQLKRWVALSLLGLLLAACSDSQDSAGKAVTDSVQERPLVVALPREMVTLDPIKMIDTYTVQVLGQIFEGLAGLDEKNRLVPLLAERWEINEKGDVWTFHLRRNVWFHESPLFGAGKTRQMVAEDVRFSFERLMRKDAAQAFALVDIIEGASAYQSGKETHVSGIEVVDDHTIRFRLIHPERTFVYRIASPWFPVVARESAQRPSFGVDQVVGTGPYRLESRTDTEVVLARNPRYWRPVDGDIEMVRFVTLGNEQLRLSELKSGRVDLVKLTPAQLEATTRIEADGTRELKQPWAARFSVSAFRTFNIHLIGFNTERVPLLLRQAIAHAIDRRALIDAGLGGDAWVNPGPVPAGLPDYTPPGWGKMYDPEQARQLLKTEGYGEHPQSLSLLVHDQAGSERIGTLIQSQLAEVGILVRLERVDFGGAIQRIIKGDTEMFSMFFEFVFSSPDQILGSLFDSRKIPVPNFWRYKSEAFDQDLAHLQTVTSPEERRDLVEKLERRVVEDAPAVFLYQAANTLIYPKELKGVRLNGYNVPLLWQVRRVP